MDIYNYLFPPEIINLIFQCRKMPSMICVCAIRLYINDNNYYLANPNVSSLASKYARRTMQTMQLEQHVRLAPNCFRMYISHSIPRSIPSTHGYTM